MSSVVFLRGVNLGKRRLTNAELAGAFERLGHRGARPFQSSGNVMLATSSVDGAELEAGLAEELGWPVEVFCRSTEELVRMLDSPFAGQRGPAGGKPQIILMAGPLDGDTQDSLAGVFPSADRHAVDGAHVHWLPAGGLADAGPLLKALDEVLGVTTVRTLGTIERIARAIGA